MSQTVCDACTESTSGYCYAHSTRYVPLAVPNPPAGSTVPVLSSAVVRKVLDYRAALVAHETARRAVQQAAGSDRVRADLDRCDVLARKIEVLIALDVALLAEETT